MKRKLSKINRISITIFLFIAICSFISYICKYPSEALKTSCAGIGAFALYCTIAFLKGVYNKG